MSDEGWYSIHIDEGNPKRVVMDAGGFPDTETAEWFVDQLEDFMVFLVNRVEADFEEIGSRTHRGVKTIN